MRRRFLLCALVGLAWVWVVTLILAPQAPRVIAAGTYLAGSFICHQKPERSFYADRSQLPVCARCTGLYVGGAVGVTAWLLVAGWRRTAPHRALQLATTSNVRVLLAVVAAPTLITVLSGLLGVWDPQNMTRALLAVPFGCGLGAVVSAAAAGDLR
jgi:uncharacterized membrane protein